MEMPDHADLPSIHTILMLSQLRWAGYVVRVPDHWLPKRLFYSELQQGVCSHGGQKKRSKDTLKISVKVFDINPDTWQQTALDGGRWRYSTHKGASLCTERRTAAAQQRRQARKIRAGKQEQVSHIPCPSCRRTFRARICLISHLRIHKSPPSQPQDD